MEKENKSNIVPCIKCNGTGKVKDMQMTMCFDSYSLLIEDNDDTCENCDGVGRIYNGS